MIGVSRTLTLPRAQGLPAVKNVAGLQGMDGENRRSCKLATLLKDDGQDIRKY
jgi:hypothetical protein